MKFRTENQFMFELKMFRSCIENPLSTSLKMDPETVFINKTFIWYVNKTFFKKQSI